MSQRGCGKDLEASDAVRKTSSFARRTAPFGFAQGRLGVARPTWAFSERRCKRLAGLAAVLAGRDPSTPHVLSLCESTCSAQDDNFGRFSVHCSYIIWKNEHEGAVSFCCGAGEDSAAEDFYWGVVGKT
jgi:hypothetical protein